MQNVELSSVELSLGTVEYRVAGPDDASGPPVVFVHGLLVNGELWTTVADRLATDGVRSYAPTLPLGSHTRPFRAGADLTPLGVARIVLEFLDALDLTDVTLVGSDTGGAICQFLIDTDHSRIGRLVLTNCDAFDKFPPAPFNLLPLIGRRPAGVKAMLVPMRRTAVRHSWLGFGGLARTLDADVTRRWVQPGIDDADVRRDTVTLLQGLRPADLLDVSTRLDRFTKPVRLVWGDKDPFFTFSFAERLRDTFPNATLVRVEGGRTFLALDEPDRVAAEIRTAAG